MNEESQVRGCYNVTFIYTNQETVGSPLQSDTWAPRQQLNTTHFCRDTGGKDACGPSAQVLTTSCFRAINLSPNQKKRKKERLKCQGPKKNTIMYSVTYIKTGK